jgi:hypothetical protein
MKIIAHKKFQFVRDEILTNTHGELTQKILEQFTVSPNSTAQVVPDWIRDNDLYKLAVQDGAIESLEPVHAAEPEPVSQPL